MQLATFDIRVWLCASRSKVC